ncbi:MAG: MFS transporter, partial [Acidimicrobiia bacterium]|nr:MFS transporter [Acidimicrobiia bacterium]
SYAAAVGQAVAVGKLVYDISGRELDLGLVGLAEFLPTAMLVLVAGALADRFDRRRLAAIGYAFETLISIGLAIYAFSEPTAVWPAFLLVFLFGTARGFVNPAARALPPSVAPPGGLARLVSMHSAMWQFSIVVGPVVAGFLYVRGPAWPFVAFALFTTVSGVCMFLIELKVPQTPSKERPTLHSALEGLRFVRRTPILLAAIGLDLFAVLFGGAVALAPALAEDRLDVGAIGLGMLRAAGGVGAAVTAIALTFYPLRRLVGRRLLYAVGLFGLGTIGLGLTRSFVVALALLAAIAAADMVSVYVRGTVVPLATPDAMRGRVLAVEAVFIGASNELGAFESGVTAHWFGLVPAIVLGGILTIAVVIVWWFAFPALREVDRFDDIAV